MVAAQLSRASATLLGVAGLALLFAADVLLPRLVPGVPDAGAWLGQVLAAALLALAWLNWLHRDSLLGGIYGRPVVLPNAAFYMISALSVLRSASRWNVVGADGTAVVWTVGAVTGLFAVAYWWLLYRGPLERDLAAYRTAHGQG